MITRRQARLLGLTVDHDSDGAPGAPVQSSLALDRATSAEGLHASAAAVAAPSVNEDDRAPSARHRRSSAAHFLRRLRPPAPPHSAGAAHLREADAAPVAAHLREADAAPVAAALTHLPPWEATAAVHATLRHWLSERLTVGAFECPRRAAATAADAAPVASSRSPLPSASPSSSSSSAAVAAAGRSPDAHTGRLFDGPDALAAALATLSSPTLSDHRSPGARKEQDEARGAAGGRSAAPYARVTSTQARAAWRGCVRSQTSTTAPAAAASRHGVAGGRAPQTQLHAQSARRQALQALQSALARELPYYLHLSAHQARMRALLHQRQDDDGASGGAGAGGTADTDGEAAYLQMVDPSKSAKDANIVKVITAIDAQLTVQMRAVYADSVSPTHADERETPMDTVQGSYSTDAHQLSPARRLELVHAFIAAAASALPSFESVLMPYQQEGVRWLLQLNLTEHFNGILADDMGLGKTAQSIVYLGVYKVLLEGLVDGQLARLQRFVRGCLTDGGEGSRDASEAEAECVVLVELRSVWALLSGQHDAMQELNDLVEQRSSSGAKEHSRRGHSTSAVGSEAAALESHPRFRGLQPYFTAVRTLKQLKQWFWQLSGEDVEQLAGVRSSSHASGKRATAPGRVTRPPQPLPVRERSQGQLRHRLAAAQQRLLQLPRKRGRPSTADRARRMALEAAITAAAAQMKKAERREDDDPAQDDDPAEAEDLFSSATALPGMSAAASAALMRPMRMRPVLVIAPLSTLPHWMKEFEHFGLSALFEPYVLNGSREARDEQTRRFLQHVRGSCAPAAAADIDWGGFSSGPGAVPSAVAERLGPHAALHPEGKGLAHAAEHDFSKTPVLLIPHDLLTRHGLSATQRRIAHVDYHLVIIDEAQRIKNHQGALFSRVCQLRSVSRLVLTGTPLQNNIGELFALLQFLAPQTFRQRQQRALFEQLDAALAEASRSRALEDVELRVLLCRRVHRLLSPFLLRRDKSVIKALLPVKKDYTVVCPLLPYQAEKLAELEVRYRSGCLSGNPHIQRRKILLHPYTLQPFFYVDESMLSTSGKLLVLDYMMRFLVRTGHKFLVFCGWTLVLDVVESLCGLRGVPYVRLDGSTSAQDRETRIANFNACPRGSKDGAPAPGECGGQPGAPAPCCFLVSKGAGGVGLNLQSADTVFLLDVDYNPQRDNQALSRVYRVGQTREVRVLRLLIDHETERGVVDISRAKENLDRAVVQAGMYDLHSSAGEKKAELQRLFGSSAMALGAGADDSSAAAAGGSPSSPTFPFGPPDDDETDGGLGGADAESMEEEEEPHEEEEEDGEPNTGGHRKTISFDDERKATAAPSRSAGRRVRFDLPDEPPPALAEGTAPPARAPVSAAVTQPPAFYLLAMRTRLEEVLPRGPHEAEVLGRMMDELARDLVDQQAEHCASPLSPPSRRRRLE